MSIMSLELSRPVKNVEEDPAEYVGFWPRFAARAIDTVLHWAVGILAGMGGAVLFLIIQRQTGRSAQESAQMLRGHYFLNMGFSFLGMVFYASMAESVHGSTLGKRLLGFVVLRENKRPCGIFAALGRQLVFFIDSVLFGLVAAYAMSGNRKEQRYGDQWCKTVVVRRRSATRDVLRSDLRFMLVLFAAIGIDVLCLMLPFVLVVAR